MKHLLLALPLALSFACATAPERAPAPEPGRAPSDLEELLSDYVALSGHNLTYSEEMAEALAAVPVRELGDADVRVLHIGESSAEPMAAAETPLFEVVRLEHASARETAHTLSELIEAASRPARGQARQSELATSILADPRTNSLLVMATEDDMARLLDLVSLLDVAAEGD